MSKRFFFPSDPGQEPGKLFPFPDRSQVRVPFQVFPVAVAGPDRLFQPAEGFPRTTRKGQGTYERVEGGQIPIPFHLFLEIPEEGEALLDS